MHGRVLWVDIERGSLTAEKARYGNPRTREAPNDFWVQGGIRNCYMRPRPRFKLGPEVERVRRWYYWNEAYICTPKDPEKQRRL